MAAIVNRLTDGQISLLELIRLVAALLGLSYTLFNLQQARQMAARLRTNPALDVRVFGMVSARLEWSRLAVQCLFVLLALNAMTIPAGTERGATVRSGLLLLALQLITTLTGSLSGFERRELLALRLRREQRSNDRAI